MENKANIFAQSQVLNDYTQLLLLLLSFPLDFKYLHF